MVVLHVAQAMVSATCSIDAPRCSGHELEEALLEEENKTNGSPQLMKSDDARGRENVRKHAQSRSATRAFENSGHFCDFGFELNSEL